MLRIGEFSKLCRVTIKALRYYDEIGLLKPKYISDDNGYRYYDSQQLKTASEIVIFKEMGFSLDEITVILRENVSQEKIYSMLLDKQTNISSNIRIEQQRLTKICAYIKGVEEVCNMTEVLIKEIPEVIVASMRQVIPNYQALMKVVPAMGEKMGKHGAICAEPAYCFNIYHDGEYKETDIDVEICEAIIDFCKDADGVVYKKIPGFKTVACLYHKGPYETLGNSYAKVFEWIEKNDYKITNNPRESYIDGIWNKEDESEWLTEIQVPVEKK